MLDEALGNIHCLLGISLTGFWTYIKVTAKKMKGIGIVGHSYGTSSFSELPLIKNHHGHNISAFYPKPIIK